MRVPLGSSLGRHRLGKAHWPMVTKLSRVGDVILPLSSGEAFYLTIFLGEPFYVKQMS